MRASVVIVAYNSGPTLVRCLESLSHSEPQPEVIVVNNGDRGPEILEAEELGFVRVIEPGENLGFAGGCDLGAEHATGEVLAFLNPDTTVTPGTVAALARAVEGPAVGIAMGRLRLLDRPDTLNSAGCAIHISGLAWSDGYGDPVSSLESPREITYANGSAMAIRAALFRELGGFTSELFIYHEDLELGWRVRMRGLRVVVEPSADVFHDYEFGRNPTKNYYMERNRLIFVSSAYSGRLLLLLSPLLVATEVALAGLALRQGWFRDKAAGWKWVAKNRRWLLQHRRKLQQARTVPDRELAPYLTSVIDPRMIPLSRAIKLVNPLLSAYWAVARRLL